MKTTTTILLTLLTATAAHADVKNVGGLVCMRYADSEAPKSAEFVTSGGRLCNDSNTERLRVLCPLTQDMGNDEDVTVTFDYVMWNLNGLNGQQNTYPEQEFLCTVVTRTRHAQGAFWGGWKTAATPNTIGYGETPTGMSATAPMLDPGFAFAQCYIPRKYDNARSCVSHLRYDEH